MLYAVIGAEVEKVCQLGNLVAKSFFRNQALAAIFLDKYFIHFFKIIAI